MQVYGHDPFIFRMVYPQSTNSDPYPMPVCGVPLPLLVLMPSQERTKGNKNASCGLGLDEYNFSYIILKF